MVLVNCSVCKHPKNPGDCTCPGCGYTRFRDFDDIPTIEKQLTFQDYENMEPSHIGLLDHGKAYEKLICVCRSDSGFQLFGTAYGLAGRCQCCGRWIEVAGE